MSEAGVRMPPDAAQVATGYAGAPTPWPFCFSYPVGDKTGSITYQGVVVGDGIPVENGERLMDILNQMHTTFAAQSVREERQRLGLPPSRKPPLEKSMAQQGRDAEEPPCEVLGCMHNLHRRRSREGEGK